MLKDLLKFEWYYHMTRPLFYITCILFSVIGYFLGSSGIVFPNVHINSPYQITYVTGLLSLAATFSITLSIAQSILREKETRFDMLVYASAVPRPVYLFSRFSSLLLIAIFSLIMAIAGLYLGHGTSSLPADKIGSFSFSNYIRPLLILAIPNAFLCVAILCSTAWVSGNKLLVYVSGLCIYILYIIGSIFSNSPLMAGSAPSSPEQMDLFAKLDPFGMAAFFEQTRYWNALERNTLPVSLSGNFLLNRILWMSFSLVILILAYFKFSSRSIFAKPAKKKEKTFEAVPAKKLEKAVNTEFHTKRHNRAALSSFIRIDLASVLIGIPFILIMIMWTALLGIELTNAIQGDPRLGHNYASSELMISAIMETIPFFALIVIVFYSSELMDRSRLANFEQLENTTAVHPTIIFISKLISLSVIPFFLVAYSCLVAILLQLINGYGIIDAGLYSSLFYWLGLPLLLNTVLVMAIQTIIKNKYAGLAVAAVVILLTNSRIGMLAGIRHPLLRYANSLTIPFGEMNGFGNYVIAFHWQMIYWTALAVCLILVSSLFRNRNEGKGKVSKLVLGLAALVFLGSGGYIFYQTNIKYPYQSETGINKWKQDYETNYKIYKDFPRLTITAVKTIVDLYPKQNRYVVKGQYRLLNYTDESIDSVLVYIHPLTQLQSISIKNAKLIKDDAGFGHYWYRLNNALQPGDSTEMNFDLSSEWSPFKGHTAFNSIIDNGSFMRISNYFPSLGYESNNEITNSIERKKRKMPTQDALKKLEAVQSSPYKYEFIDLNAVVSTEKDQLAIGQGELLKQWSVGGRNYYHYKTAAPIPFRFAFSSARYTIKKDIYKGIAIEVYYDEHHAVNVDKLISDTKKTLEYCEANFGPYPYKIIRYAEISGFAEGFAATAYPSVIYMKENAGFYNRLDKGNEDDAINQLAGHELSHQWWGSAQIDPEQREGAWILTETLAKYTELMLYQRSHGLKPTLDIVRKHIDLYLSNRSFSEEAPLFKTTYETPHLPYNKGLVVMYQLQQLLGETTVNAALKSLFEKHAFPKDPPTSQDLINAFYRQSPDSLHRDIDELFKEIILYDSKIEEANCKLLKGNEYELYVTATIEKYRENGNGRRTKIPTGTIMEIGIWYEDGSLEIINFPVQNGILYGKRILKKKPVKVVIDPLLKTIDSFLKDNEREIFFQK